MLLIKSNPEIRRLSFNLRGIQNCSIMSKLNRLTNNIRLLEFEPTFFHFASEQMYKYVEDV